MFISLLFSVALGMFVGLNEERIEQNEYTRRITYVAAPVKRHEDQLRRTTRDRRWRVSMYTEVDGGILEHFLWTVTNLSFLCKEFVIETFN
jgi:hypothetical protein